MKTTRRAFLQTSALASLAGTQSIVSASDEAHAQVGRHAVSDVNAFEIAKRHTIRKEVPGPSFVEGMLLGNGDVGVCAVVRPDALGLHIGKNDCWDIRVSPYKDEDILTVPALLDL